FFESDTAGEKLYEEFYTDNEDLDVVRFHALGVIRNAERRNKKELDSIIKELENLFKQKIAKEDVVKTLNKLLPTFQHIETGLNLDQKM
ncbi:MAG TPA: nucleoside-diphosphate sugar epimerase, partial [Chitinophagaceae bacterium]|nr:nucleoside-diphosphate sugar epimerase [Chitinophagaceae bacterium]